MSRALHKANGFTLIEVLVAVVIIAIGLLGLAGLQATVIGNGHVSSLRSIASIHTENMAELMRANIAGANANVYAQGADATSISYANPAALDCAGNTVCIRARSDALSWTQAIARDLTNGTGRVTCSDRTTTDADPCTNGSSHTITVGWQEKDDAGTMVNRTFSTVFRP